MRGKYFLLIAGMIMVFAGCSNNADNAAGNLATISETEKQDYQLTDTVNSTGNAGQPDPGSPGRFTVDWDKKIIRTAQLAVEVQDYKKYNESFREIVKKLGGYIANENQQETDYKIENNVVIKIPVAQFEQAVSELINGSDKTITRNITSEDVTTQMVDTRARLEAKKQVRYRYLELLKQAKNMEDILGVQSEINSIQEEIEAAAGRLQYMQNASSYSTIHLSYHTVLNPTAKDKGEPGFASKAWQSFKNGWNWIGEVFIGVIAVWPLWLIVFAAWMGVRRWRQGALKQQPKSL
jgi:hypothetical protein